MLILVKTRISFCVFTELQRNISFTRCDKKELFSQALFYYS